jgi:hypothetical protein
MLDVGSIKSVLESEVQIKHPQTGAPLGAFVTIAAHEHPQRRKARADVSRRLRAAGNESDATDLVDEVTIEVVARSVLGWRGIKEDGVEVEFSPDKALELLSRPELDWLVKQLLVELGKQENFIQDSAQG